MGRVYHVAEQKNSREIEASARAYLNAINRLLVRERNAEVERHGL